MKESGQIAEETAAALVGWRVRRLQAALAGPLAVVASGATRGVATLWARLHEHAGEPAWALSPADLRARRAPPGTRVLLLSTTGRHHDILGAARDAVRHAAGVHAVVYERSAPLCGVVRSGGGDVTVLPRPPLPAGLADPRSVVPMAVLAARLYGGSESGVPSFRFAPIVVPPERPRAILALGAGLARPAAEDFARRCREVGFADARAADLRDVAHGDLLAVDPAHTWLMHFTLPGNDAYLDRYDACLPPSIRVLRVRSRAAGAPGGVELFARSGSCFRQITAVFGVQPQISDLPDWLKALYRLPMS